MDNTPSISPYTWILALAIAVIALLVISVWEFNVVQGGLGILALSDQKTSEEITSLRQELTGQRETIEALKAQLAGAHAPAAATPAAAAAPAGADHPRGRPHH
jgi:hypothetical protein